MLEPPGGGGAPPHPLITTYTYTQSMQCSLRFSGPAPPPPPPPTHTLENNIASYITGLFRSTFDSSVAFTPASQSLMAARAIRYRPTHLTHTDDVSSPPDEGTSPMALLGLREQMEGWGWGWGSDPTARLPQARMQPSYFSAKRPDEGLVLTCTLLASVGRCLRRADNIA